MRAQRRHREAPSWQWGAGTTGEQSARPAHLSPSSPAGPSLLARGRRGSWDCCSRKGDEPQKSTGKQVFSYCFEIKHMHPMESHLQPYLPSFPSYTTFHIPYPICYSWKTPRSESELFSKTQQTCRSYSYHRDASTPCHRQSCRNGSSDPHEQHALFQSKAIPSCPRTIRPLAVNFIGAAQ